MKKKYVKRLTSIIAILSLISVCLLWRSNIVLFFVLLFLSFLFLYIRKSKEEIKLFIFCCFFGAITEIIAIKFGVWSYSNPNFINIPIWLTLLWGIAGVLTYRAGIYLR